MSKDAHQVKGSFTSVSDESVEEFLCVFFDLLFEDTLIWDVGSVPEARQV